jgi:hypothetical protein
MPCIPGKSKLEDASPHTPSGLRIEIAKLYAGSAASEVPMTARPTCRGERPGLAALGLGASANFTLPSKTSGPFPTSSAAGLGTASSTTATSTLTGPLRVRA